MSLQPMLRKNEAHSRTPHQKPLQPFPEPISNPFQDSCTRYHIGNPPVLTGICSSAAACRGSGVRGTGREGRPSAPACLEEPGCSSGLGRTIAQLRQKKKPRDSPVWPLGEGQWCNGEAPAPHVWVGEEGTAWLSWRCHLCPSR